MTLHPHLNRNSNRLHKLNKKIIRDNRKSFHDKIPLLNDTNIHQRPLNLNLEKHKQHSAVAPFHPNFGKSLGTRNEQNVEYDSICIIL